MDAITVLLADDHAEFRTGLLALVSAVEDFRLIGEADVGFRGIWCAVGWRVPGT